MIQMKYVMNDENFFVLLPIFMQHSDVIGMKGFGSKYITSAGFVSISEEEGKVKVQCYGESKGLNTKANEQIDADIIAASFR